MASSPITSWQIDGEKEMETTTDYFLGLQNHCRWWLSHEIKRHLLLGRKAMTNLDSILKGRDITLPINVHLVKAKVFPVVMYGCESYEESWALKNWCFWTVVLEKILESPLDCKENKPVNPEENQSWIFIGRTDAEAEAPTLWPQDVKNGIIVKDLDAEKDWMQEEKGTREDEMVGWQPPTRWTWVWVSSGSWWWTGKLAVLQCIGSQRVRHN